MTMIGVEKPECPCSRGNDDNLPGIPVFRPCKNKAKSLDWCLLGIPVLIENLFTEVLLRKGFRDTNNLIIDIF